MCVYALAFGAYIRTYFKVRGACCAGEIKDAKIAPGLELVMDQVVGIGLGEECHNPALDARLRTLAQQQGSVWEPDSPDGDTPPPSAQVFFCSLACHAHRTRTLCVMLLFGPSRHQEGKNVRGHILQTYSGAPNVAVQSKHPCWEHVG